MELVVALRGWLGEHRPDAWVCCDINIYYREGDPRVVVAPDVAVAFGVDAATQENKGTYKVWEAGVPPSFALEIASPNTFRTDLYEKPDRFADLGVEEYWRLDPAGELMAKPLEGCVARAGGYEPVPVVAAGGRTWLWSEVLGLELRGERRERGTVLVFRDPRTGEEWASADERERLAVERERQAAEERASAAEREREAAEREREAAEQRASAADARVRALEEQLRALIADTTNPSAGG